MNNCSFRIRAASLAAIAAFASVARADDWLMFRKDPGRTARVTEDIRLPLAKAWTFKSKRLANVSVLSTVVVREGTAFFTAAPPGPAAGKQTGRNLVAADARTGAIKWTQPLASWRLHSVLPEDIGPSVSQGGIVFAVDAATVLTPCPRSTILIKAFQASDGKPIDTRLVPVKNELARFFLRDGHGQENYFLSADSKPDT